MASSALCKWVLLAVVAVFGTGLGGDANGWRNRVIYQVAQREWVVGVGAGC